MAQGERDSSVYMDPDHPGDDVQLQLPATADRELMSSSPTLRDAPDTPSIAASARRTHNPAKKRTRQNTLRLFGHPVKRWIIVLALSIVLVVTVFGTGATLAYEQVKTVESTLAAAQTQVRQAQALLPQLSQSPLDHTVLERLRGNVAGAENDFIQAQQQANVFASAQGIPGVSQKAQDAFTLIQMGVDLTGATREMLDALIPIIDGLRGAVGGSSQKPSETTPTPAATSSPTATTIPVSSQPPPALTNAQFVAAQAALKDALQRLSQAAMLRKQLQDNGASLGASVVKLVGTYDHFAPDLQKAMNDAALLLQAAPVTLGVQQPITYLIELLDASELRAGGGFIGNYGIVTLDAGRITNVNVRDTYLLDDPYLYGNTPHTRAFPSYDQWFLLNPSMALRDSNLTPDFADNAQIAERILAEESGQHVAGVIAISPTLIANLLTVTGPVLVPGYNVTVTSTNLVAMIHYYQFQTNDEGVPSSDGQSSVRKHFTAILGGAFFSKLRTLSAADMGRAIQIGLNSLKTKDLQVYLNNAPGESLLGQLHLSNTLAPAQTDTMELVDDNIGGNKATAFVQESAKDQVVVAPDGSSTHTLTVHYTYTPTGNVYGNIPFKDVVQVYVPPGSHLISTTGLLAAAQVYKTSTREAWTGQITLNAKTSHIVIFVWKTPVPPQHTGGYELLVGRQADSVYSFAFSIQTPAAATHVLASPPLQYANGVATYQTRGILTTDLDLKLTW